MQKLDLWLSGAGGHRKIRMTPMDMAFLLGGGQHVVNLDCGDGYTTLTL